MKTDIFYPSTLDRHLPLHPTQQKTMRGIHLKIGLHSTGPIIISQNFNHLNEKSTKAWTSGMLQLWRLETTHHYLGLQLRKWTKQLMQSRKGMHHLKLFASNMQVQFVLTHLPGWQKHMNSVHEILGTSYSINLPLPTFRAPSTQYPTINLITQVSACGLTWCLGIGHGAKLCVFGKNMICHTNSVIHFRIQLLKTNIHMGPCLFLLYLAVIKQWFPSQLAIKSITHCTNHLGLSQTLLDVLMEMQSFQLRFFLFHKVRHGFFG